MTTRNIKCPIWGTPAEETTNLLEYMLINSARAGGRFHNIDVADGRLSGLNPHYKAKLTT